MAGTVYSYLLSVAKDLRFYYEHPVVAIDVIAGESRAKLIDHLADEIKEMDDAAAVQHLMHFRERFSISNKNSFALMVSLSERSWYVGVVDWVARENTGWIEVGSAGFDGKRNLNLPRYRRMLGINHSAGCIERGRKESDADWLVRRAEWLAHYHPEVRVLHHQRRWLGGRDEEIVLGSVQSFIRQEHLVEADLVSLRGIRLRDGREFEMLEAYLAPRSNGAIGRVRQTCGETYAAEVLDMRNYTLDIVPA